VTVRRDSEKNEEVKQGSFVSKETLKEMTEKQNEIDKAEEEQLEINEKARIKSGFLKWLSVHNKPTYLIATGLFASMIAGSLLPVFGVFWAELIMDMTNPDKAREISIIMAMFAPISFVVIYVGRGSWCFLAENMTKNIRHELYGKLLWKEVGWFDHKSNSPGQLTSVLATEVQTLNGVSTESMGVAMESAMGMLVGIVLGFIFCWPVALIALGISPFMMLGAMINAKVQKGAGGKGNTETP
jgi:ABC-type multidrug transport system fused ATPase/permease subunit